MRYVQNRCGSLRFVTSTYVDVTSGHFGVAKTVARIKERFMWKGILSDVKSMVTHVACGLCNWHSKIMSVIIN